MWLPFSPVFWWNVLGSGLNECNIGRPIVREVKEPNVWKWPADMLITIVRPNGSLFHYTKESKSEQGIKLLAYFFSIFSVTYFFFLSIFLSLLTLIYIYLCNYLLYVHVYLYIYQTKIKLSQPSIVNLRYSLSVL